MFFIYGAIYLKNLVKILIKNYAAINFCIFFMVFSSFQVAYGKANVQIDVLIDVSQSMRKNDPQNLRKSAAQLFYRILPQNVNSSAFVFDEAVKRIIVLPAPGKTFSRENSFKQLNQINANGQYTNIELALESVLAASPQREANHFVILLTDGFVDIGKNKLLNDVSRQNILTKTLKKYKERKIKILTIALSGNADFDLLKKLSFETDGLFKRVDSASDLEKTFLTLFESSIHQQGLLPAQDGSFLVDERVNELTLILFKDADYRSPTILSPTKKKYIFGENTSYLKWYSEKNYDLITIKNPERGKWYIDLSKIKIPRFFISSDLTLDTSEIASNVFLYENFEVKAFLLNKNNFVDDERFSKLIAMTAGFGKDVFKINYISKGIWKSFYKFDRSELGDNNIEITASSPTFSRTMRKSVMVHDLPFSYIKQDDKYHLTFTFKNFSDAVVLSSVSIKGFLQEMGSSENKALDGHQGANEWIFNVPVFLGKKKVKFLISGQTSSGRHFAIQMPEEFVNQPINGVANIFFSFPNAEIPAITPSNLLQENKMEESKIQSLIYATLSGLVALLLGFLIYTIKNFIFIKKINKFLENKEID